MPPLQPVLLTVLPTLFATAPNATSAGALWVYATLFVGEVVSWAGVPMIGTVVLGSAGLAASQGVASITVIVIVATVAGEIGGLTGYAIGHRWGTEYLNRPGKHQEGRQKALDKSEDLYAKWGRLAVFFTPAVISGTARMKPRQFALWNLIESFIFAISVGHTADGIGRLISGHHSAGDIAILVLGLVATGTLLYLADRHHKRRKAAVPDIGDATGPDRKSDGKGDG